MVWQAIIPAVTALAGAVISKPKAAKRVTPLQIRREAEAAGFNPLTVLRGAAGGGFGMNPTPPLSSAAVIAQAIGKGVEAWNAYDPVERETKEIERDLLRVQLETAKGKAAEHAGQGPYWSHGRDGKTFDLAKAVGIGGVPVVRKISDSPTRKAGVPMLAKPTPPHVKPPGPGEDVMEPSDAVKIKKGEPMAPVFAAPGAISMESAEAVYGDSAIVQVPLAANNLAAYLGMKLGDAVWNKYSEARKRGMALQYLRWTQGKGPRPKWLPRDYKPKPALPFK